MQSNHGIDLDEDAGIDITKFEASFKNCELRPTDNVERVQARMRVHAEWLSGCACGLQLIWLLPGYVRVWVAITVAGYVHVRDSALCSCFDCMRTGQRSLE